MTDCTSISVCCKVPRSHAAETYPNAVVAVVFQLLYVFGIDAWCSRSVYTQREYRSEVFTVLLQLIKLVDRHLLAFALILLGAGD